MKNISGRYTRMQGSEDEKEQLISEISVDNLNDNIISIEFNYQNDRIKLTGVLHHEGNGVLIYLTEKYTEKYFICGLNMKTFAKTGVHGYYDSSSSTLKLQLVINQFNKSAVNVNFVGKNTGGIYPDRNLKEMRFFFSG